jgi:hypothetical protein
LKHNPNNDEIPGNERNKSKVVVTKKREKNEKKNEMAKKR